jgi:hypothetical protein
LGPEVAERLGLEAWSVRQNKALGTVSWSGIILMSVW